MTDEPVPPMRPETRFVLLRFRVGREAVEDLIADLANGLSRWAGAT